MPLYEYQCKKCSHEFEELIRTREDELTLNCPHCGGRQVRRLMSATAAHTSHNDSSPCGGSCDSHQSHSCPHASSCGCFH